MKKTHRVQASVQRDEKKESARGQGFPRVLPERFVVALGSRPLWLQI